MKLASSAGAVTRALAVDISVAADGLLAVRMA